MSEENTMSTPATVQSSPDAYGERQQPQGTSSEGVMDNLSRVAQEDVAAARTALKAGYDAALSQLDMQYGMEKTRLAAQYADLDGRLVHVEESIASYKATTVKAMDSFLTVCKTASITAVELVPVAPPRRSEEYVEHQDAPEFLSRQDNRAVTPLRRPLIRSIIPAVALAAIVVLTTIGVRYAVSGDLAPPQYAATRTYPIGTIRWIDQRFGPVLADCWLK